MLGLAVRGVNQGLRIDMVFAFGQERERDFRKVRGSDRPHAHDAASTPIALNLSNPIESKSVYTSRADWRKEYSDNGFVGRPWPRFKVHVHAIYKNFH
jgi:hypothetical protein